MSRTHAMSCKIVSKAASLHRDMGQTFRHCAVANRANPRPGEPRNMEHSDGSGTGADLRVDGMPINQVGQSGVAIVDYTFVTVMAPSNQNVAGPNFTLPRRRLQAGDVEQRAEDNKITNNEYQIDAHANGYDFYGISIGKETGVFGPRCKEFLARITSIREGEEYEHDPINEHGFKNGMWSAPTALAYWTRVLMVKLTIRREVYIERAFYRARKAAGLT